MRVAYPSAVGPPRPCQGRRAKAIAAALPPPCRAAAPSPLSKGVAVISCSFCSQPDPSDRLVASSTAAICETCLRLARECLLSSAAGSEEHSSVIIELEGPQAG